MARHYPLDQDLAFERYEHRNLEVRDILINRLWEIFVTPAKQEAIEDVWNPSTLLGRVAVHSRQGRKIPAVEPCDLLHLIRPNPIPNKEEDAVAFLFRSITIDEWLNSLLRKHDFLTKEQLGDFEWTQRDFAFDAAQRFYFEVNDPSVRFLFKQLGGQNLWSIEEQQRTRILIEDAKRNIRVQDAHFLYSGGFPKPDQKSRVLAKGFHLILKRDPLLPQSMRKTAKDRLFDIFPFAPPKLYGRASSLPAPDAWATARHSMTVKDPTRLRSGRPFMWLTQLIFHFPRRRFSELDKLARRRSLSRSHIRNMFKDPPVERPAGDGADQHGKSHPCSNCGGLDHKLKKCSDPCGHCGKKSHLAVKCPVKPSNRCKCKPFPRHVATECREQCSRRCGNPFPFRDNKHLNAMSCNFRCCMCGKRDHSGKQCSFKRCQCGKQHLTQSCRWKVECPAARCDRYLCGLHCSGCGKKRDRSLPFTGGRCQECLEDGKPVRPRVEET